MRNLLVAMVAVCVACGGGSGGSSGGPGPQSNGSNAVNGTIGGQSMSAKDAVSAVVQLADPAGNPLGSVGLIVITNATGTCAMLGANQEPKNGQALLLAFGGLTMTGFNAPSATGSYPVFSASSPPTSAGNAAIVSYKAMDASCAPAVTLDGVSGTVNVKKMDSTGYSGDFDITFSNNGGHVTGTFSSANCAALSLSHTAAPTCT